MHPLYRSTRPIGGARRAESSNGRVLPDGRLSVRDAFVRTSAGLGAGPTARSAAGGFRTHKRRTRCAGNASARRVSETTLYDRAYPAYPAPPRTRCDHPYGPVSGQVLLDHRVPHGRRPGEAGRRGSAADLGRRSAAGRGGAARRPRRDRAVLRGGHGRAAGGGMGAGRCARGPARSARRPDRGRRGGAAVPPERVAGSIAFQGIAAQVVAPLFAAVAVHGVLPAADVARALHWRPGGGGPWLWWPAGGPGRRVPGSRRPGCPGHDAARPGRRRRPGAGRGRRAGAVGQRRRRPWRARGNWSRRPVRTPLRAPPPSPGTCSPPHRSRPRRRCATPHRPTSAGPSSAARAASTTGSRAAGCAATACCAGRSAEPAPPEIAHCLSPRLGSRTGRRWRSRPAPATRPGRWSSPQRVRGRDPRCTSSEE